jgi:hypothetical protein
MLPDPYMVGIVKLDKLIKSTVENPVLHAEPEARTQLIDELLEQRSDMMAKRARGFRIRDNRRIK